MQGNAGGTIKNAGSSRPESRDAGAGVCRLLQRSRLNSQKATHAESKVTFPITVTWRFY